jgi:iron complex transport system substrate-binding protein
MRLRTLAVLLCLLLLVACGQQDSDDGPQQQQTPQTSEQDTEAEQAEQDQADGQAQSIVDDVGRVVELETPVDSAIAFNNYTLEFIRAIGAADKIVAMDDVANDQPEYWSEGFDTSVTAGSQGEPDWEQIADSDPDVVILPRNGVYEEAQEQLEPFGIKTVVITGWDATKQVENVSKLGVIFGERQAAQKLNDFHQKYMTMLEDRLADVERKPLYWETGTKHHTVVPGSGWHDMLENAKVQNIFGDVTSSVLEAGEEGSVHSYEIDPEKVLLREPEIIVNRGHSNYESSSEELRGDLEEIVQRPGWNELPAVQSNNVHSITRFAGGAVSKMIGALYVANWAYPDEFDDVNPDDVFQTWIEDFQGVPMPEPGSHSASL